MAHSIRRWAVIMPTSCRVTHARDDALAERLVVACVLEQGCRGPAPQSIESVGLSAVADAIDAEPADSRSRPLPPSAISSRSVVADAAVDTVAPSSPPSVACRCHRAGRRRPRRPARGSLSPHPQPVLAGRAADLVAALPAQIEIVAAAAVDRVGGAFEPTMTSRRACRRRDRRSPGHDDRGGLAERTRRERQRRRRRRRCWLRRRQLR